MPRSPDFFRQLNEQLLEQLEEYARQPGRTGDEVLEWLTDRKVQTSRAAVYRWLQDFRLEDRTRRAGEVARMYLDAARESDPHAVTEASLRKFEELVFDHLVSTDETDAKDLFFVAQAMKTGLGSRKELVEMKRRQTEAVKAAEETVKAGGDGAAVAQRVREILGIKG
jgi:Fe2+ or Zn2+ uptake regulation protein